MINIFIAFLFISCSFNLFAISTRYCGINRTIISVPMEVFESAIKVSEDDNVYFNRNLVRTYYEGFINEQINKYSSSHSYSYFFYNIQDHNECFNDLACNGVEITINATVFLSLDYTRTMFYEIG